MDAHEMTMPRSAFSGEEHFPDIPEERESYLSRMSPLERTMSERVGAGGPPAPCALLIPKGFQWKCVRLSVLDVVLVHCSVCLRGGSVGRQVVIVQFARGGRWMSCNWP